MVNVPIRSDDQNDQIDQNQSNTGSSNSQNPIDSNSVNNSLNDQANVANPDVAVAETIIDQAPNSQIATTPAQPEVKSEDNSASDSVDSDFTVPTQDGVDVAEESNPSVSESSVNQNQQDAKTKMEDASNKANDALDDMINTLSSNSEPTYSAPVSQMPSTTESSEETPPVTQEIPDSNDAVQGIAPLPAEDKQSSDSPPVQE